MRLMRSLNVEQLLLLLDDKGSKIVDPPTILSDA
jgi:hypothetical protein